MDAAYLKAAQPKPFRVLTRRLLPFCIGHEILFQRFGVKFSIEKGESPGIGDLFKAVHICSRSYSRKSSLDDFKIPFRVKILSWLYGVNYLQAASSLFQDYLIEHTATPDFYMKDDGNQTKCGAPTVQAVKVSLMANLGMSEEEALNTPFSLAFWNHLTYMESQGVIQIIDEEEVKRIADLKKCEAAIEAYARSDEYKNFIAGLGRVEART